MSGVIQGEALFFLASVSTGVLLLFGYDLLRALRAVFPGGKGILAAGDFLYWCLAGVAAFCVMVQKNSGVLRGFSVAGMLLGMLLYHASLSKWILKAFTLILRAISTAIRWFFHLLCTPWRFFSKKVGKKAQKRLKKKVKEIRMYVNKH